MTTNNRLAKASDGGSGVSGYRAAEWAKMARDRGYTKQAEAWAQADREGWDERHFSLTRREQLADQFPGAFGRQA